MCTVLIAFRATPGALLAVSANRNEFLEREARGPELEPGSPRVWAPRDLKAGGTWLGMNERGLFVCITNRRHATVDAGRRSRGELAHEALRAESALELHRSLAALPGDRYNGFHLIYADRRAAFVTIGDGERIDQRELTEGLHLITERSFGAGEGVRERECRAAFEALFARGVEPTLDDLRTPLQAHGPKDEPLESACVHAEIFGYGTRSSLQLLLPREGKVTGLWTEGRPCTQPAREVSAELQQLLG